MRALLVVSKAQATVRALSIRKAGATTLTLLAVSLCGPEPGTVWRARRAVAFYDRRQDTRAGAARTPALNCGLTSAGVAFHTSLRVLSKRGGVFGIARTKLFTLLEIRVSLALSLFIRERRKGAHRQGRHQEGR